MYPFAPVIQAIADNSTAIVNSKNGKINFYDGKMITKASIKSIFTKWLEKYEVVEDISKNIVNTFLRLIETNDE